MIDQIPGVDKQTAMETFPAMIVALNAGAIDGYISERPGALAAVEANPGLSFISFEEGKGFTASPEDVAVAVGLKKGSELTAKINEVLAGITKEERQEIMETPSSRRSRSPTKRQDSFCQAPDRKSRRVWRPTAKSIVSPPGFRAGWRNAFPARIPAGTTGRRENAPRQPGFS